MANKQSKNKILSKKLTNELKNKTVLVTGGAGSVGMALVKRLLTFPVSSIRVLDIDEHALFKLKRSLPNAKLRLLLGSILDKDRIEMAGKNVDIIFHLAAVKNIEISEYNPIETIDVNVNGTVNMIKMAMTNRPQKFVNISTDKSAQSSTLYGTTKLLGERVIQWAGSHLNPPTKFANIRFGNVMEARGNVFEVWSEEMKLGKPLSLTHPDMKRYFFHVDDAVDFILTCLPMMNFGELFIPKMKQFSIKQMAKEMSNNYKIIGTRKGEKLEEILMTDEERKRAIELKDMWIIRPDH